VRKRGGRKRALGTRSPMALPDAAKPALVTGFCVRRASSSRRFRVLAVKPWSTLGTRILPKFVPRNPSIALVGACD
jgi:hypothetical protein